MLAAVGEEDANGKSNGSMSEMNDYDNALILSFDLKFAEKLDIFFVESRVRFVHMLV